MIKVPSDEPWTIHIPHLIIDTICGFLITLFLRKVFSYINFIELKLKIALHVVVVITATLIWTQIKWITLQWFYG
ncbi:MAG: transcriptional regulator, partial [Pseudomonadota bacterium]|nr:transcriptional regulator [Pseudomonadota bacterium]